MTERKLALVTGASSGIGLELAKQCAEHDFDLVIVADEAEIESAAEAVRAVADVDVQGIRADLAAEDQIERVLQSLGGRAVDLLCANAGRGMGKGFVEQDWPEIRDVIDTNITGTIYLTHRVARAMRDRGEGRILFTGSIAGFIPGTFQAVYNASKAFIEFVLDRAQARTQGQRCQRHGFDARRHRDPLLRTGRHARHRSRSGREG